MYLLINLWVWCPFTNHEPFRDWHATRFVHCCSVCFCSCHINFVYGEYIFSTVQLQHLSFEKQVIILSCESRGLGAYFGLVIIIKGTNFGGGGGQGVCSLGKFWNLELLRWWPETIKFCQIFITILLVFCTRNFCLLFSTKIRSTFEDEKIHAEIVGGNLANPMIALDLQSLESTFWEAN